MAIRISVLTKEYVRFPVEAKSAGIVVDPTALVVQMAFTVGGANPGSGDWKTASWETDATTEPDTYFARCLVGGAGTGADAILAVGTYTVWMKITDTPEIPVHQLDELLEVF